MTEIPCWWRIAGNEAERCPNPARWKDGNPATQFMRWCDEHRHADDIPLDVQATGQEG